MTARFETLCAAFQHNAAQRPDAVALRSPGDADTLTWRQYADKVRAVAAGLSGLGVRRGDTVALMMANRIEFYPLEVGAQHLGATSFSVYNTLPAEQIAHVLTNSGARVVMCEAQYVDRLRASGMPLDHVVCVDEAPTGTISVAELMSSGAPDFDFDGSWRAVRPDDVATLIYTSGTTGPPKGVETTHANLLFECYAVEEVLGIRFGDTITSYLPSAHIADRLTALYFQLVFGTQITCVDDPSRIGPALADLRPTIWGAVPRVWEKLRAAIGFAVAAEPEPTRAAIEGALEVGGRYAEHKISGTPVPADLQAEWARADALILSGLRAKLGLDRVRWALSGAAPIPRETLAFFAGLGIPITEIWGMSELTCICSISHPEQARLGTVGTMLPGMTARLADDGELLVRGPLVMKGYRGEPEKTAEAIDPDGWLHTGDIITIDDHGYLTVVDRKKELIINAAGKNMSPAHIENTIKAHCRHIGAIATIGDARPYNTALIVLDPETPRDPELLTRITQGIAAGNAALSRVEQIKRFRILPAPWEPGGDELTPTMKLKRRVIEEKYAREIEELYAEEPGVGVVEPG
ncbi:fatty acid--CoA ligase FadD11 [Nocardia wallacei]|uniref:Acyl-CoA synthetase n=1 Tax=Nocardia wallacei TaxID=480035 RepID=A0A7G1KT27_9NOCA|nr:fatty acid--CoA ligase FadD11 [Nocardia wallacei]BCK58081.1 fatty-acid--CoA ligase [Nocardia wallacei]